MPLPDKYLFGRRGLLPRLAVLHACVFVVLLSWLFGGNAIGLRPLLLTWGCLALPITGWALYEQRRCEASSWGQTRWLLPFLLLNVLVIAGLFNPSFRTISTGTGTAFIRSGGIAWLPGSAVPEQGLQALCFFDCLFLTAFNLLLAVRRRRHLRALIYVLLINGVALSIFGTFQKLSGATGLFFDRVPSPNPTFFSSFIYHNHWGAFTLLLLTACIGMIWHAARRSESQYRGFLNSPAFLWLVAAMILASTIPLCSSRSCTLLLAVLGFYALGHAAWVLLKSSHLAPATRLRLFLASLSGLLLVVLAIFWLAGPVLRQRWELTVDQIAKAQTREGPGARLTLYRDTLTMAMDRPLFGWGMASFPVVFQTYNTQKPNRDRLPVVYVDAHNDWAQALAEHGLVGTALLVLMALLPLSSLRHVNHLSTLPRYLLAGCLGILLYALVEFPFGNPAVVCLWWLLLFSAVLYPRTD